MNDIGSNYMIRAAAHGGLVRALAVNATSVVEALRERHGTFPSATAALGRLATGALLFGAVLKEEDQLVTIRVQGDGPGPLRSGHQCRFCRQAKPACVHTGC